VSSKQVEQAADSSQSPGATAATTSPKTPPDAPISIVAVHGNGGGAHRFSLVAPQLPPGFELRAVTLPGFAAVPRDPRLVTIADYARRLAEMVEEIPRPRVLLGHGIGGSIAFELAQHGDVALDGLILHAPVGANLDTRWFPMLMSLPGMRGLGQGLFASGALRWFFRSIMFSNAVPRAYSDQFFDEYGTCSVFGEMFDLITFDWFASLRPISMPSAILWGAAEKVLTVDQLGEFKKLMPDAFTVRVVGWGHFPMAEAPRSYADEVAAISQALVAKSRVIQAAADESAAKARAEADARVHAAELAEVKRHNEALASWGKPE
jgi:pimeloyl-ACP methyl ester carboxylesterase